MQGQIHRAIEEIRQFREKEGDASLSGDGLRRVLVDAMHAASILTGEHSDGMSVADLLEEGASVEELTERSKGLWGTHLLRPLLLVLEGTFEQLTNDNIWAEPLERSRTGLELAIASVGRVERVGDPSDESRGTAWMIAEGIVATNGHVALDYFASSGEPRAQRCQIDFLEEFQRSRDLTFEVAALEFVDKEADIALMRLRGSRETWPRPLQISGGHPEVGRSVTAIGYPGNRYPGDTPSWLKNVVTAGIYEVKRLQPGKVSGRLAGGFNHDCSTAPGNSGSPIVDIEAGEVVGMHHSGRYPWDNYAVSGEHLLRALRDVG